MSPAELSPQAQSALERLKGNIAGSVLSLEPMSAHTTIGLGGPADIFVRANSHDDLLTLLQVARDHSLPVLALGSGSNLLVSDAGVRGVVVALGGEFDRVRIDGESLTAGAGVQLSAVISKSAGAGLSGLHNVYGVPGTIGGSVFMNAGTRYGSISDTIRSARLITSDGEARAVAAPELGLSYRQSALQGSEPALIVTEASFVLEPKDPSAVKQEIAQMAEARRSSQPLNWRSCGCIFRNPVSDSAGRLIDSCGLKGRSVGGVSVSDTHANFFVTKGEASASDVIRLIRVVQRRVLEQSGVELELEVQVIGDWPDE